MSYSNCLLRFLSLFVYESGINILVSAQVSIGVWMTGSRQSFKWCKLLLDLRHQWLEWLLLGLDRLYCGPILWVLPERGALGEVSLFEISIGILGDLLHCLCQVCKSLTHFKDLILHRRVVQGGNGGLRLSKCVSSVIVHTRLGRWVRHRATLIVQTCVESLQSISALFSLFFTLSSHIGHLESLSLTCSLSITSQMLRSCKLLQSRWNGCVWSDWSLVAIYLCRWSVVDSSHIYCAVSSLVSLSRISKSGGLS